MTGLISILTGRGLRTYDWKSRAFLFLLFIVVCGYDVRGQTVLGDVLNNRPTPEYEKWMAPFRDHALGSVWRNSPEDEKHIKLVIAVVTDREPPAGSKELFSFNYGRFSSGSVVSTDGQTDSFRKGPMGSSGGCCSHIEKIELEQIDRLLSSLPSDHGVLPPNDRRIVVQIPVGEKFLAQVYDLSNVPDAVLELLRTTKSHIGSLVSWRDADIVWPAIEGRDMQAFAVSPDGRRMISSSFGGPMMVWDIESQVLEMEAKFPQNVFLLDLIVSPDNSTVIGSGWGKIIFYDSHDFHVIKLVEEPEVNRKYMGFLHPQFIDNGKYLLFETSPPGFRVYETKTWKKVSILPEIPTGAVSYYPTAGGSRVVYAIANGDILLRNARRTNSLMQLDKDKLEYVSFSPDESKVVVVTSGLDHEGDSTWIRFRIRMWDTATGEFLKELLPYEQTFCESVDGVQWSPDGKFFMAAAADNRASNRNIDIWNVESGRHRVALSGCVGKITGFQILSPQNKIVEGCADNKIRIWGLSKITGEIRGLDGN